MNDEIEAAAEHLFAEWLADRERGEAPELEALCSAHPDLAIALRELALDLVAVPLTAAGLGVGFAPPVPVDLCSDSERKVDAPEVDGYLIQRLLGQGGMGAVFEAQEVSPPRLVALKVLRTRISSARMLRRFEYESEALARLQHPGVAQILRTGRTSDGSPFFAMELVDGRTITEFASARKLTQRDRVELLVRVCDAVDHAHQRGVIHRDLKPANILVTETGQPKVLDFGVARLAGSEAGEHSTLTGEVVGTLAYMSPEQAAGDARALDTRSDVYALGVLLYELLAGRRPYEVSGVPIPEALRLVCSIDPPRLGTIHARLRGDLETIVATAMAKEPDRRYTSAAQLGADLRRFLRDEPIEARPASAAYQITKFARRHRVLVIGSAAVLLAVLLGLVGTLIGLRRERDALKQRDTEAAKYRVIADHTGVLLGAVAPAVAQGLDTSLLRMLLDASSHTIADRTAGQPEAEAALHYMVGSTYLDIASYAPAEEHLRRSVELYRTELGADNPETLQAEVALAMLFEKTSCVADAVPLIEHVYRQREATLAESSDEWILTVTLLAETRRMQGDLAGSLPLYRRARELARAHLPKENIAYIDSLGNFGWALLMVGEIEEAILIHEESLALRTEVLGPKNPRTIGALSNLGYCLESAGHTERALESYRDALAMSRTVNGPRNPSTLALWRNYADTLAGTDVPGAAGEAEAAYREILRIAEEDGVLGSPEVVGTAAFLGRLLWLTDRATEALAFLEIDLARHVELYGPGAAATLDLRNVFATVLSEVGLHADAKEHMADLLGTARSNASGLPPFALERYLRCQGEILATAGDDQGARVALDEALSLLLASPKARAADVVKTTQALIAILRRIGDTEQADYLQAQLDELEGD